MPRRLARFQLADAAPDTGRCGPLQCLRHGVLCGGSIGSVGYGMCGGISRLLLLCASCWLLLPHVARQAGTRRPKWLRHGPEIRSQGSDAGQLSAKGERVASRLPRRHLLLLEVPLLLPGSRGGGGRELSTTRLLLVVLKALLCRVRAVRRLLKLPLLRLLLRLRRRLLLLLRLLLRLLLLPLLLPLLLLLLLQLLMLLLQPALLCHVCAVRRLLLLLLLLLCLLRQHRCRPDGLVPQVSQRGEASSCRDPCEGNDFRQRVRRTQFAKTQDSGLETSSMNLDVNSPRKCES